MVVARVMSKLLLTLLTRNHHLNHLSHDSVHIQKATGFPSWTRNVPTIDDDGFVLAECPAILCYLAEKHGWDSLYPLEPLERARVHEYMHWHHRNIRECSLSYFMPIVHPDHSPPAQVVQHSKHIALSAMSTLEARLAHSEAKFLHGDTVTLSDLLCYGELGQLSAKFFDLHDFTPFPGLHRWMSRMEALPHFAEAHQSLVDFLPTFRRFRDVGRKP
eukprot:gnl/TRDRNA2_/TRDRNA2_79544_c0_seq3.p1 gnl/TRDRNA2_/TRDRNA2_79544_c0~~gnl/TRDRNA2_/TRDRNA2_79544_c0_seq3.p1  ORF type:complete len:217 (+),score=14.19 gnl/TRDRNA2_/TRDRNA2_79544_c0_seq3:162-812(+)